MRVLIRDGRPVDGDDVLGPVNEIDLGAWYHDQRPQPTGRPWVLVGMISSIDGGTAVEATSSGLANLSDRMMLTTVRRAGQVVIVGSTTAADESYRPRSFADQRVGVVTGRGELDFASPLFTSGVGFVITTDTTSIPSGIEVIRAGAESVDFTRAIAQLDSVVPAVTTVVVEGGPTLNGTVVASGVVDEVCVTTAPFLIAGPSDRLAMGSTESDEPMGLHQLLIDSDGYLFARWVRVGSLPHVDGD